MANKLMAAEIKFPKTMADFDLVSIVLATYNGEAYLSEQLESLFHQSYPNIEIIAVDDGSTDATVSILKHAAVSHHHLKVFVNPTNLGFIKNFEKGCTLTTGKFIALCDQDDYWEKEKITKLVKEIGEFPMVYHDSKICNETLIWTGKNFSDLVNLKSWNNCMQLSVFCRMYAHSMLFKRTLFNAAYPFLEVIPPDWWLPYISTFHGGMKYINVPLVLYRQHTGNISGIVGRRKKQNDAIVREKTHVNLEKIRARVNSFYDACPSQLGHEKKVLKQLFKSYQNFSVINNFRRLVLFLKHQNTFLAVKKHSLLHRFLFCLKMFVKIK